MHDYGEFGPLDAQMPVDTGHSPTYQRESALVDTTALELLQKSSCVHFIEVVKAIYIDRDIKVSIKEIAEMAFAYVPQFMSPLVEKLDPIKIAKRSMVLNEGREYAIKMLMFLHPELERDELSRAFEFVEYLVAKCPTHGFTIEYEFVSMYLPFIKPISELGPLESNLNRIASIASQSYNDDADDVTCVLPQPVSIDAPQTQENRSRKKGSRVRSTR